jgi:hypothetical protein
MKPYEKTHNEIARTYRLQEATVKRINALSATLNIYQSTLIDALLTDALDAIDAGRLKIHTRPVKFELNKMEWR